MYLTKPQMRALWFMVLILAAALGYHYVRYFLTDGTTADFRDFEQAFIQRRDSIHALQESRTPGEQRIQNSPQPIVIRQFPININTAGVSELQALPRIGPAMAMRIVKYREEHGPFPSKKDLKRVRGIGPKTFQKLENLIVTE